MLTNKRVLGSVVALTLLGFALRFFHLNTVSLRGDEAFTVLHWMREPLAQTLANIATVDPQAPLSYALFRGWALVMGTSEYVARILPALLSVVGIPIIYALGHRLDGRRLGTVGSIPVGNQSQSNLARTGCPQLCDLGSPQFVAVWLALRALDNRRRIDWALYIVAGTLAAYVYYLELFIIVALSLYVFMVYWRDRRLLLRWIGAEVAIGLLLAPWYLQSRLSGWERLWWYGRPFRGTAVDYQIYSGSDLWNALACFWDGSSGKCCHDSRIRSVVGPSAWAYVIVAWEQSTPGDCACALGGDSPALVRGCFDTPERL